MSRHGQPGHDKALGRGAGRAGRASRHWGVGRVGAWAATGRWALRQGQARAVGCCDKAGGRTGGRAARARGTGARRASGRAAGLWAVHLVLSAYF